MLHPFKDWSQEVIYEGASFHEENNPIKLGAQPGPFDPPKKLLILPLSQSLCSNCWFALLTFLTNMWVANFCFNMILACILIVYSIWLTITHKDVWGHKCIIVSLTQINSCQL